MPRWALVGAVMLAMVLTAGGGVATVVSHPAAVKPPVVACVPSGRTTLTAEQRTNATTIIAAGRSMGVPDRGLAVALATALQESTLRNLSYGDRDSLGLFQQRPSQGWGSPAQVQDPVHAAQTFYRHLVAIPDWETLPITGAAQTVQHSAFPDAYAKWEPLAAALVSGTTCMTTK